MEHNTHDSEHEQASSPVGIRVMIGVVVTLFVLAGIVIVSILA
jgi:hypothetical protein